MLKKVLLAVGLVVAALAAFVASRPAAFRVERSAVIKESPRAIYEAVADFHRWEAWSPWARLDPGMKTSYAGTPGQVGSTYQWAGNDKIGEGRMTIVEVHPPLQVKIRLEFLKPWQSTNETVFDLYDEAGGTRLVWSMRGQLDFVGKAMGLVMDMDKAVGPDFERGLASLKQGVEAAAATR